MTSTFAHDRATPRRRRLPRRAGEGQTEAGAEHGGGHGTFPAIRPVALSARSSCGWRSLFGLFYLFLKRVALPRVGGILEVRSKRIAQRSRPGRPHEGRGRRRGRRLRAGTRRGARQGQRDRRSRRATPPRPRPTPSASRSRPSSNGKLAERRGADRRDQGNGHAGSRHHRRGDGRGDRRARWSAARSTRPRSPLPSRPIAERSRPWTPHSGRPSGRPRLHLPRHRRLPEGAGDDRRRRSTTAPTKIRNDLEEAQRLREEAAAAARRISAQAQGSREGSRRHRRRRPSAKPICSSRRRTRRPRNMSLAATALAEQKIAPGRARGDQRSARSSAVDVAVEAARKRARRQSSTQRPARELFKASLQDVKTKLN